MARSTHGSRRALPWAVVQNPRPTPRVVRLGRAANDNARSPGLRVRLLLAFAAVAVAIALLDLLL